MEQMVEDQLRLLAFQQALEQETLGLNYVGLSINETVHTLIIRGNEKKAEKLRSDFKIPDKRFVELISIYCSNGLNRFFLS